MTEKKETRGGKRAGAGRKASEAGPLVRATFRMSAEDKQFIKDNGGAALIRKMICRWRWEEGL